MTEYEEDLHTLDGYEPPTDDQPLSCRQTGVYVQEDGYVHSILVPEGEKVAVGAPIALMTEYEEDLHTLDGYEPPTDDLYQEGRGLRTLTWQSYLKDDKGGGGKGCS